MSLACARIRAFLLRSKGIGAVFVHKHGIRPNLEKAAGLCSLLLTSNNFQSAPYTSFTFYYIFMDVVSGIGGGRAIGSFAWARRIGALSLHGVPCAMVATTRCHAMSKFPHFFTESTRTTMASRRCPRALCDGQRFSTTSSPQVIFA